MINIKKCTTGMKMSHKSIIFCNRVRCLTVSVGILIAFIKSSLIIGYANRTYVSIVVFDDSELTLGANFLSGNRW